MIYIWIFRAATNNTFHVRSLFRPKSQCIQLQVKHPDGNDIRDLTVIDSYIRPDEDMAASLQCVTAVWVHAAGGRGP